MIVLGWLLMAQAGLASLMIPAGAAKLRLGVGST